MGSFDGTEVCEVVGLYLLNKIKPVLGSNNVGLRRKDVLVIVHTVNGPKVDRLRQDIIGLFRDEGLSIASDTNLIEKDFLDRSLNLNRRKYFPIRKSNNTHLYIHSKSNHLPSIIKQLPSMTNNVFQAYLLIKLSLKKLRLRTKQHLKTVDSKQR